MRAALLLLLASATAAAHPVLIDREPPPPPSLLVAAPPPPPPPTPAESLRTWLGLRFGAGALPVGGLDVTTLGLLQVDAQVEVAPRTRAFAEYALMLAFGDQHDAMRSSLDGVDHRFAGGLGVELYAPGRREIRFPMSLEAGGGVDLISGQFGAHRVPFGFVGARVGFELSFDRDAKRPTTYTWQLMMRVLAEREGVGTLFGIGMQWGS